MKKLSFLKCFVETLSSAFESLVKTLPATSLLGMMLLAPMGATAQVTVGSSDLPQATLDVVATKTDGSTAEGIIAPRLTLANLNAAAASGVYGTAQTGTLVYVTLVDAATVAQTANIDEAGYYFFDGTLWRKFILSIPANTFIYDSGAPAAGSCLGTTGQNSIYTDTLSTSATLGRQWICDGTTWQTYVAPPATAWYLANTTNDAGATKSLWIYRTGRVGIGTSTPARQLHIKGSLLLNASGNDYTGNIYTGTASEDGVLINTNYVSIQREGDVAESKLYLAQPQYIEGGRNTFIKFFIAGAAIGSISANTASSVDYITTSDSRLKENIVPTHFGINDLMNINVVDFNFKSDAAKTQTTGFLAQDLYNVYPAAVSVGGDDADKEPWGVDYGKITPLLVKAIQEQQAEIETLKAEIEALKNQ